MTEGREREITQAFVSLANALVDDFDVVEVLSRLAADCARLLDISSAGLLLADRRHVLHVAAASSEDTRNLELFQLQRDQGPCLECYRLGEPVTAADLAQEAARWPQFVQAAEAAGFTSVHAIPMRLRSHILGTLGLFGRQVGHLGEEDLRLAQALAHVASVAIVQAQAVADATAITQQLQNALSSRVIVEQAKGILAQRGELDMTVAFDLLRRYARDHNLRVSDLAQALVSRQLPAQRILDYWQSKVARQPRSSTT